MIDFLKTKPPSSLVMRYVPERGSDDWLVEPLRLEEDIPISAQTFYVRKAIYRSDMEDSEYGMDACYHFIVGQLDCEYYRMDRRFLGIEYKLFLHKSLEFRRTTFVAETNIPIFRGFNDYGFSELYVGGDRPNALPAAVFEEMLRQFPNTYELKKYARARVSSMIRNYVPIQTDFAAQYQKYRERKVSAKGSQPREQFSEYESDKFSALIEKMESMLLQAETYSEIEWQKEILQRFLAVSSGGMS